MIYITNPHIRYRITEPTAAMEAYGSDANIRSIDLISQPCEHMITPSPYRQVLLPKAAPENTAAEARIGSTPIAYARGITIGRMIAARSQKHPVAYA